MPRQKSDSSEGKRLDIQRVARQRCLCASRRRPRYVKFIRPRSLQIENLDCMESPRQKSRGRDFARAMNPPVFNDFFLINKQGRPIIGFCGKRIVARAVNANPARPRRAEIPLGKIGLLSDWRKINARDPLRNGGSAFPFGIGIKYRIQPAPRIHP